MITEFPQAGYAAVPGRSWCGDPDGRAELGLARLPFSTGTTGGFCRCSAGDESFRVPAGTDLVLKARNHCVAKGLVLAAEASTCATVSRRCAMRGRLADYFGHSKLDGRWW